MEAAVEAVPPGMAGLFLRDGTLRIIKMNTATTPRPLTAQDVAEQIYGQEIGGSWAYVTESSQFQRVEVVVVDSALSKTSRNCRQYRGQEALGICKYG